MLQLPSVYRPTIFGDEIVLRSIDWVENLPWRQDNSIESSDKKFEILLDVQDFAPEEISVKTSDGLLFVEGKHDEKRDDNGYISRHFLRKYRLPEGCKIDRIKSRLTPEGVLIISAPKDIVEKQDTVIPVSHLSCNNKSKL